ncbi:MAG: thioredoxin family protein [Actinobacteria bacterium]|nr:thioredoxin family protein [Actinomycetota bacterium]|tara:strand:- start:424 stop:957 length:534 start_codon:yes stop_codon:yes gene_type:complete
MPNIKINEPYLNFLLPSTEGKDYSLDMPSLGEIKVVIFSCNHCPYAQAWEDRIIAIQDSYKDKGVSVIMISSNDPVQFPEDNFEKMKERHSDKNFNFPYLFDESQEVAKNYGAERTPEVFIFNNIGLLQYTGAIDDNYEDESSVKSTYLKDALNSILADKKPVIENTDPVGCTIKWK